MRTITIMLVSLFLGACGESIELSAEGTAAESQDVSDPEPDAGEGEENGPDVEPEPDAGNDEGDEEPQGCPPPLVPVPGTNICDYPSGSDAGSQDSVDAGEDEEEHGCPYPLVLVPGTNRCEPCGDGFVPYDGVYCVPEGFGTDAGTEQEPDAGGDEPTDAGTETDAGAEDACPEGFVPFGDLCVPEDFDPPDAGNPDAGEEDQDAGTEPEPDAGTDAGTPDAGNGVENPCEGEPSEVLCIADRDGDGKKESYCAESSYFEGFGPVHDHADGILLHFEGTVMAAANVAARTAEYLQSGHVCLDFTGRPAGTERFNFVSAIGSDGASAVNLQDSSDLVWYRNDEACIEAIISCGNDAQCLTHVNGLCRHTTGGNYHLTVDWVPATGLDPVLE